MELDPQAALITRFPNLTSQDLELLTDYCRRVSAEQLADVKEPS
jgi:hypothetical protein